MKYIRTKDGRIEIVRFQSYGNREKMVVDKAIKIETEILKEADAIEDLLDETILVCVDGTHELMNKSYDGEPKEIVGVYGAIWIKGEYGEPILKSVAKLNEKGVFELS